MFSGKLGRALMPIVSIILFLWLIQSFLVYIETDGICRKKAEVVGR
jgi:hypothetical protein